MPVAPKISKLLSGLMRKRACECAMNLLAQFNGHAEIQQYWSHAACCLSLGLITTAGGVIFRFNGYKNVARMRVCIEKPKHTKKVSGGEHAVEQSEHAVRTRQRIFAERLLELFAVLALPCPLGTNGVISSH